MIDAPRTMAVTLKALLFAAILALAVVPAIAGDDLEGLEGSDIVVTMDFPDAPIGQVIDTLGKLASFRVSYEGGAPLERTSRTEKTVTIGEVLDALAREHGLTYEVPEPDHLVVILPQS